MDWSCDVCHAFTIIGVDAPGHAESSAEMIAEHQKQHAVQQAETVES